MLAHIGNGKLVDVRSPQEYSGELLHMPEYPQEGALRGGHIPTAASVPWRRAAREDDGTFLPVDELRAIYEDEIGLAPKDDVIAYCRDHMARFKAPKTIVFTELPKTATGKIQKFELRQQADEMGSL